MDDYVSKPVELADLKAALGRWMGAADEDDVAEAPATSLGIPAGTLDPEVVATLRGLTVEGQPDAFVTLMTLFSTSSTALLETLRDAMARADAEGVARVAHTLKGSAANVGAVRLADACRRLEESLPGGMGAAAAAVVQVEAAFGQVEAWLTAELGSNTSGPAPGGGS